MVRPLLRSVLVLVGLPPPQVIANIRIVLTSFIRK